MTIAAYPIIIAIPLLLVKIIFTGDSWLPISIWFILATPAIYLSTPFLTIINTKDFIFTLFFATINGFILGSLIGFSITKIKKLIKKKI